MMPYVPNIEPDPREAKLPRWARELLDNMRSRVRRAEADAEAAILATNPEQTDTVVYRYGDRSIGLPPGSSVEFRLVPTTADFYIRQYLQCRIETDRRGTRLIVHGGDALQVRPVSSNAVEITVPKE